MAVWQGMRGQQLVDEYMDYSSTIQTGGNAQICIPQRKSCSHLVIMNVSSATMYLAFGVLPGIATLTSLSVTSVAVQDTGFGFLLPPTIEFIGGGNANDPGTQGATMPDWPGVFAPATAIPVMASSALGGLKISSITVTYGGAGYIAPPYVRITPDRRDPLGVGLPSATFGSLIVSGGGGSYYVNGPACPTCAIAVVGANTGQPYTAKWMP